MNKDEIKKDEIKRGLECCSVIDFETGCIDCPYYNNGDFSCDDGKMHLDALNIIIEQEKEIEQLTRELAKGQETCVECETKQSWELFVRDKEIDRLRTENERFENNMRAVLEIEKKNVVKEFAKKLKVRITRFTGLHDLSVRFFNDIVSDLLKRYEK